MTGLTRGGAVSEGWIPGSSKTLYNFVLTLDSRKSILGAELGGAHMELGSGAGESGRLEWIYSKSTTLNNFLLISES